MKRTDTEKVLSAQDLVDQLLAMAATVEYNAGRVSGGDATRSRLLGRAEGFKRAAGLLDELL